MSRIIASNKYDVTEEEYLEFLHNTDTTKNEVSFEEYVELCHEVDSEDYDMAIDLIEDATDNKIIVYGSIGRWNGVTDGYEVFETVRKAFNFMMKDCDLYELGYDEEDKLYLECSHYDGTNRFYIVEMTDEGSEFYDAYLINYDTTVTFSETAQFIVNCFSRVPQVI